MYGLACHFQAVVHHGAWFMVRTTDLDAGEWVSLLVIDVLLNVEEGVVENVAKTTVALQVSQSNESLLLRIDHVQHLQKRNT